tara:strand:- start:70 stop:384 length:315 start_codon:yes stop_codon:yes gene_type:complete
MSFFISKEIKELVSLDNRDINKDINIINVSDIDIDNKFVKLTFAGENNLKKEIIIDRFMFHNKEYVFSDKVSFTTSKLKKVNTNIITEIIICKDIFWRYLKNEE